MAILTGMYLTDHVVGRYRAVLPCGCYVVVGRRTDNWETATDAAPCSDKHDPLIERFQDLMRWSLLDGGVDRPLIEVVDEILQEAERETSTKEVL